MSFQSTTTTCVVTFSAMNILVTGGAGHIGRHAGLPAYTLDEMVASAWKWMQSENC
jgi:hypothetical protein